MGVSTALEERRHELRKRQLTMIDGKLTGNASTVGCGRSARAYEGGYWGFAAGPDSTAPDTLRDHALRNARALSGFGARETLTLPAAAYRGEHAGTSTPLPTSQLVERMQALHAWCAAQWPGLTSVRFIATDEDHVKQLRTSHGADLVSRIRRGAFYAIMVAVDDEGRPVEIWDRQSCKGGLGDLDLSVEAMAPRLQRTHDHLQAKRHAVPAKGGLHTVVMGPKLTGILAHEAMGHPCEGDIVLGGAVTAQLLGKTVASPLVSMVDLAHTWRGQEVMMPVYADDEGTPATDAVLIDRGVLRGFMHSRETAARLGLPPTGSARAYKPDDEPLVRMRNTVILPGEQTLQQLIEGVDEGYYLVDTSNGQADTTTEFMFGISLGFEIKGGRLGRAVRDTTLSGSALSVLASVDGVGDDMHWDAGGYCGKKQPMVVSMAGPSMRARAHLGGE